MKNTFLKSLTFALFCALVLSCQKQEGTVPGGAEPDLDPGRVEMPSFVPGLVKLYLNEELADSIEQSGEIPQAFLDAGVQSMQRLFPHAGEFEPRTRKSGLHKWYMARVPEDAETLTKAGSPLWNIPGVEIVTEVPFSVPQSLPFNDPLLERQWHYHNPANRTGWKEGADVNVFPVWESITTGSPNIKVAVIDGGIDVSHEDLAANLDLENSVSFLYNAWGQDIKDYPHDHGTHVAGTIAAINNNGKGVCGIAGGDAAAGQGGVKLMSLGIFYTDSNGKDWGGAGDYAMKWAADHGAVISQNSWGYTFQSEAQAMAQDINSNAYKSIRDAIDYFNRYAGCDNDGNQLPDSPMKGGVVIFAAGNEGWKTGLPACYDGVVAVGASSVAGRRTSYSNYGDWVDIAAPGGDSGYNQVEGTQFCSAMILSTVPGGGYSSYKWAGTSMACPHVSGVAALLLSYYGKEGFTREQLIHKLVDGANYKLIPASDRIGGQVDAWGSFMIDNDLRLPEPCGFYGLEVGFQDIAIDLGVMPDGNGGTIKNFFVIVGKNREEVEQSRPYSLVGDAKLYTLPVPEGAETYDVVTVHITDLGYDETYYAQAYSAGQGRLCSEPSETFHFTTMENLVPEVIKPLDAVAVGLPGTFMYFDLDQYFVDPEGMVLEYSASVDDPSLVEVIVDENSLTLYPHAKGRTTMHLRISDGYNIMNRDVAVSTRDQKLTVDFYPNPVVDKLHLRTSEQIDADVIMTSSTGNVVFKNRMTIKADGSSIIDMNSYASGAYNISVTLENGKQAKETVIKL